MRFTSFIAVAYFFSAALALAQTDHSVGVPRYVDDTVSYRFFCGMGGNLGHINDAPLTSYFSITHQTSHILYGLDFINSTGSGPSYLQPSATEYDLLIGYSWDRVIPVYDAPPVRIHYAIESGLSFDSYTHIITRVGYDYSNNFIAYNYRATDVALGFPIRFSAIYEPFHNIGIGATIFYTVSRLQPSYGDALILELRF